MIGILRRTFPCRLFVAAVVLYALPSLPMILEGRPLVVETEDGLQSTDQLRAQLAIAFCALYGFLRACAANQRTNDGYYKWLKTTPWRPGMAFPICVPYMHLYWADAMLVGFFFMAELFNPMGSELKLIIALLLPYIIVQLLQLGNAARGWYVYFVVMGLGLVTQVWSNVYVTSAVLGLLYLVVVKGQRSSFADFPFAEDLEDRTRSMQEALEVKLLRSQEIRALKNARDTTSSTAFNELSAHRSDPASMLFKMAFAAFVGWWTFIILEAVDSQNLYRHSLMIVLPVMVGPSWLYSALSPSFAKPPISIRGRIQTGDLIVPRYDIVFLSHFISAVVLVGLLGLGNALGAIAPWYVATCCTVYVLCLMFCPPTSNTWRFTGQFHNRFIRADSA
ncbi:MAG TPA: hypothetical protein PKN33_03485 [Phycisphaerae bacterium]|nr:hypothetical protein [Phycisphaerae bacterium]